MVNHSFFSTPQYIQCVPSPPKGAVSGGMGMVCLIHTLGIPLLNPIHACSATSGKTEKKPLTSKPKNPSDLVTHQKPLSTNSNNNFVNSWEYNNQQSQESWLL